jgi:hypothetical protein
MKNLLAFLAAVAIAVVAAGWYLGWFQITQRPLPHGHEAVEIDINKDKLVDDLQRGSEEIIKDGREGIQKLLDKKQQQETKSKPHGTDEPAEPLFPRR